MTATRKELDMAAQIQESMLPDEFPAFSDRQEFDIRASMDPAREVGGDFYDYFLIDDDHLAMLIADLTDKGIPAALNPLDNAAPEDDVLKAVRADVDAFVGDAKQFDDLTMLCMEYRGQPGEAEA